MQKILILDFGGQYNQLIARRVRENRVYCEVHPWSMPLEEIRRFDPVGIIFTGGPRSVYDPTAPHADARLFALGVPIGSATAASCLRRRLAAAFLRLRRIPHGNTARPLCALILPVRCFRGSRERASYG